MKKDFFYFKLLILFFWVSFFAGCSHKSTLVKINPHFQGTSEKVLQLVQRYQEYWDYFSKKEFDKAYLYELPYQRFLHSLQWYKTFNQSNDQNYTTILYSVKLSNNDSANIKSKYISSDKKTSFEFEDKWYFINGKWYHVMKTSRLPIANSLD